MSTLLFLRNVRAGATRDAGYLPTVKTAEIRRQFNTRPGENPDTLAVELRQFSCRPEKI